MFSQPEVADQALFRGGTALHKLFFDPAGRYSEDIDLVQRNAGPIGTLVDSVRIALDPWLGRPRWRAGHGRFSLHYRFASTSTPVVPMRVKIEVNTREHFSVEGIQYRVFEVENPWFSGSVRIPTYSLSELLATKLRALYQRKKGRDLFDLWLGLDHADAIASDVIAAFMEYMKFGGTPVRCAQFEANMGRNSATSTFAMTSRSS